MSLQNTSTHPLFISKLDPYMECRMGKTMFDCIAVGKWDTYEDHLLSRHGHMIIESLGPLHRFLVKHHREQRIREKESLLDRIQVLELQIQFLTSLK